MEYHYKQLALTISGIKDSFGSRYHENIIIDSSVFVQLMYAIENLHIRPFILINTPIEYIRTFTPKIKVITCANINYAILLSSIGILDNTDDEWKEIVQIRITKWHDLIENSIQPISPDMLRKKYAISVIKKIFPTFILPMQVL